VDLEARQKLIDWIDSIGHSYSTETAIPLDLYFAGNTEQFCIITCNTSKGISAERLHKELCAIRDRDDVESIFVRFTSYDDALVDEDTWINSDTVWIVTTASAEHVSEWVGDLCPSDVYEEVVDDSFVNPPAIPPGYRMVAVWWD